MEAFKISIIVPVYNVEKYLPDCLSSLVNQTLPEIEIVAVNDGSTDSSLSILKEFQEKYPEKLFIHDIPNQGVGHARNYGYTKARGKYIWFVDSDDYVDTDACRQLYEKAVKDGNDLVLFRYKNVEMETGEQKDVPAIHSNENFTLEQKPYELTKFSFYPWSKMIKRSLFEGLQFPEEMRCFQDAPVSYALFAKAQSIGYIDKPFYYYLRSVGFSSKLTEHTPGVCKAHRLGREALKAAGVLDKYRLEADYVVIRHFFFRLRMLLFNYETGKKELKLKLINDTHDFIERELPDWQENPYVQYTLGWAVSRMMYFYSSREELIRFVEACDGMTPQEQEAWIKDYRRSHEDWSVFEPSRLMHEQETARDIYARARKEQNIVSDQIFLESNGGKSLDSGILAAAASLQKEKQNPKLFLSLKESARAACAKRLARFGLDCVTLVAPGTELYARTLATAQTLITDSPLPAYTVLRDGQKHQLLTDRCLIPLTESNCLTSDFDIGLWQHSLLTADEILAQDNETLMLYLDSCMLKDVCRTKGTFASSSAVALLNAPDKRENMRRKLHLENMQVIACCPLLPCGNNQPPLPSYRSYISQLLLIDYELKDNQVIYLDCAAFGKEPDFSIFRHIRPLPKDYDLYEFLNMCDVFVSDYHPALTQFQTIGKMSLRLLCAAGTRFPSDDMGRLLETKGIPACTSAPEFARLLDAASLGEKVSAGNGAAKSSFAPEKSSTKQAQVLYYTGKKLTARVVEEFNKKAAKHPEKHFYLAYDACKTTNAQKHLKKLSENSSYLPILHNEGEIREQIRHLANRVSLPFFNPAARLMESGAKEYKKYFGDAAFDEAEIHSTCDTSFICALLAGIPCVTCHLDAFDRQAYDSSKQYRNEINLLCRLLKNAKKVYPHADMKNLKITPKK